MSMYQGVGSNALLELLVYEPLKFPLTRRLEEVGVHGVDGDAGELKIVSIGGAPPYREVGPRRPHRIAIWTPPGGRVLWIANRVGGMAPVVGTVFGPRPAGGEMYYYFDIWVRRAGVAV